MSNLNELKPIINLNPFARFCCTIGNLPSSYMASFTYEEQLMWFCDYLQNTVIPAVNNNAECVKELQELYVKLKNYVDNYFKNLDVQNEINNKLDLMVEDGTLDEIINENIFNQINNDITKNTDDITKNTDDITKNTDDITKNTDDIDTLKTNQLSIFKNFKGKVCYFSDSYGNIDTCPVNWCDELNDLLGTEVLLSSRWNGSGFLGRGGAPSWPTELQSIINQTTQEQRDDVSALIIGGGFNDRGYTQTQILNAMELFNNIAKTNFPNATIYLAFIGWTIDNTTSDLDIPGGFIYNLQVVLPAYSQCGKFGWKFLDNCQYVMHDFNYFQTDKVHPNEAGSQAIASAMYSALNGNCGVHKNWTGLNLQLVTPFVAKNGSPPSLKLDNNIITCLCSQGQNGTDYATNNEKTFNANTFYPLGNFTNGFGVSDQYRPIYIPSFMYYKNSSQETKIAKILIGFKNGQFGFVPLETFASSYLTIPSHNISFDAMMF